MSGCSSPVNLDEWRSSDIDTLRNARVGWGWAVLALKLRNSVFTREVLVQHWQHGAIFCNVIQVASCRDSLVSYWMKAMNQTLPVATYLHTINPIKHSPVCTQCDQGEVFSIFSVSVLNFITLGQQLTVKFARLWQLRFMSIWQLIGLFNVKLRSVRQRWSQNWSPLQLCCSQGVKSRIQTLQHYK